MHFLVVLGLINNSKTPQGLLNQPGLTKKLNRKISNIHHVSFEKNGKRGLIPRLFQCEDLAKTLARSYQDLGKFLSKFRQDSCQDSRQNLGKIFLWQDLDKI